MSGRPSAHVVVLRAVLDFFSDDVTMQFALERDAIIAAIAALAPVTPASENDAHEDVEIRLPAEMVTLIESVAADADVTRDQAASVIAVLAIRRYAPSRDQEQA